MSRAYRIKICNVNINFHENQNVVLDIDLLPILAKEDMKELLKSAIEQKGGKEIEGEMIVESKENVRYKIDLEKQTLQIEISGKTVDLDISVYEENLSSEIKKLAVKGNIEVNLGDKVANSLSSKIDQKIKEEEKEALATMVNESLEARQFLNKVLKDVYKEAVQKKAQSLGNVTSIRETNEDGEYRIRMEIE